MKTIVVHMPLVQGALTGMFGLFADAPIQIVEFTEESRMIAYYDLARSSENEAESITLPQDFKRESRDAAQIRLKAVAMEVYEDEEVASRLSPAIMFRLCPQMCNHE
ncbi:hypothetical protein LTR86_006324 [Recurvomyces mirabilis]|nr:hypothetical protein LTR86_006324 [Recurvomyces mirabilis]